MRGCVSAGGGVTTLLEPNRLDMRFGGGVLLVEPVLTCNGMDLWPEPFPDGTYGFGSVGDPFEKLRCKSAIFAAIPPSTLFLTTGVESPPPRAAVGETELDDVERSRPGVMAVAPGDLSLALVSGTGFCGAEKALNAPMFDPRLKKEAIGDFETETCLASWTLAAFSSSITSSSNSMDETDVLSSCDSGAIVAPVGRSELICVDGVVVRTSLQDASLEMVGGAVSKAGDSATTAAGSVAEMGTSVLCDVSTGRELSGFRSDDSGTMVASSSEEPASLGDLSPAAGTMLSSDTEVGRVEVCPDSITDVGEYVP
jgi:hypothetical protein